jgi:hypothetical protein
MCHLTFQVVGFALVVLNTIVACTVSISIAIVRGVDVTPIGEEPDPDVDVDPEGKPLLPDRSTTHAPPSTPSPRTQTQRPTSLHLS